jgi:hypothetical protein
MKTGSIIAIIIIVVVVAAIIWWAYSANTGYQPAAENYPSSTTTGALPVNSGLPTFDQSISDGIFTMSYPSTDFGLATNKQQILATSTIPPCNGTFNYCLYYIGAAYQGTNFLSAGIRVQKRPGLGTQSSCLTTEPTGYSSLTPATTTSTDYAIAEFGSPTSPINNGAAGSYSNDVVYRLFYEPSSTCYEFETRIAQSQYGNYPSGTIQQFTPSEASSLQSEISAIIASLSLPSGEVVTFPQ